MADLSARDTDLFRVGRSISSFAAVGGNSARLTKDAEDTIASLIADIDAAKGHVHLLVYIWLSQYIPGICIGRIAGCSKRLKRIYHC